MMAGSQHAQHFGDERMAAYARINNLFNRHYENPIGFLQPGFGIFAGVRVAFDTASGGGKP
jgi:vitamin B12 transporter